MRRVAAALRAATALGTAAFLALAVTGRGPAQAGAPEEAPMPPRGTVDRAEAEPPRSEDRQAEQAAPRREAPSRREVAESDAPDSPGEPVDAERAGDASPLLEDAPPASPRAPVFDMTRLHEGRIVVARQAQSGNPAAAEATLRSLIERFPGIVDLHITYAVVATMQGKRDLAFGQLGKAVSLGFGQAEALAEEPAFAPLRGDPRFAPLVQAARANGPGAVELPPYLRPARPGLVRDNVARVLPENTEWDRDTNSLRVEFTVPPVTGRRPVAPPRGRPYEEVNAVLNRLYLRGLASGNAGDLYDNRDRGHSELKPRYFPQLTFIEYGTDARNRGVDYGSNDRFIFNHITFGNSSTAFLGQFAWRSMVRDLLTRPGGPQALALQNRSNHIYVYPGHRDHDSTQAGDVLPANQPYAFLSHGKSGSDKQVLRAIALSLAAMPPDVKKRARSENLIAPTVQMLVRRAFAAEDTDESYLAPESHPTALHPDDADFERLLVRAQSLEAATLPPAVRLEVLRETLPEPGVTHFSGSLSPELYTTPGAIARVHRGTGKTYAMTVSTRGTEDPNGRPLEFVWKVMRGDPDHVRITPRDDRGSIVDIEIDWHDPGPPAGYPDMKNTRVDVAVFADNGAQLSAPGFVSLAFPHGQTREYAEDGRVRSIAYPWWRADDKERAYIDNRLYLQHGWTDTYDYAEDGTLAGWTRAWHEGPEETYTPEGWRVLERDDRGRPRLAETVDYRPHRENRAMMAVDVVPAGEWIAFAYDGPEDRQGTRSRQSTPPAGYGHSGKP